MQPIENIKKALFIENGDFSEMSGLDVYYLYKHLKERGVECIVVERAKHNKEDVFRNALVADAIVFASTFLYQGDVKSVGDLLSAISEPKIIIGQVVGGGSLNHEIEQIWNTKELSEFDHHILFELTDNPLLSDEFLSLIDLGIYREKLESDEKERIERNKGFAKTGRKVRIKKIIASGEEWSLLKEGDVVDELDCTSIDPNQKRGVWVMGKNEPVKILNDSGYEEWEFEETNADTLTREFFSRGQKLDQTDLMETFKDWVRNVVPELDGVELWEWCDNICKTLGLERRGNRSYFEKRLSAYRSKHVYFKE